MQVRVVLCGEGTERIPVALYASAWDECSEAHIMDKHAWIEHVMASVREIVRYEFHALCDGNVVGAMVVAEELGDPHVGRCLSVAYNYVLPPYRNRGIAKHFIRGAMQLAKSPLLLRLRN